MDTCTVVDVAIIYDLALPKEYRHAILCFTNVQLGLYEPFYSPIPNKTSSLLIRQQ